MIKSKSDFDFYFSSGLAPLTQPDPLRDLICTHHGWPTWQPPLSLARPTRQAAFTPKSSRAPPLLQLALFTGAILTPRHGEQAGADNHRPPHPSTIPALLLTMGCHSCAGLASAAAALPPSGHSHRWAGPPGESLLDNRFGQALHATSSHCMHPPIIAHHGCHPSASTGTHEPHWPAPTVPSRTRSFLTGCHAVQSPSVCR
jgi:hypothetical protein